ncbi:hypothetical protein EDB89DRAFT_1912079 [Lactarius sanguifluus]|nr:hypothetical protein EDB89DRAFT_1912079 [Lactarius sanguifluus]
MPVNKGGSGCGDSPPDYEGPGTHLQGKYGWRRTMSDVERLTSGGQWRERVMIDGDGRCDGVRRRIQGRIRNGSGVAEIVERERTPNFGAVKRRDVTRTHTNPLICLYLHLPTYHITEGSIMKVFRSLKKRRTCQDGVCEDPPLPVRRSAQMGNLATPNDKTLSGSPSTVRGHGSKEVAWQACY